MLWIILIVVPYMLIGTMSYLSTYKQVRAFATALEKSTGHLLQRQFQWTMILVSAFWPIPTTIAIARALAWKLSN